jgi:hypothetical protein
LRFAGKSTMMWELDRKNGTITQVSDGLDLKEMISEENLTLFNID